MMGKDLKDFYRVQDIGDLRTDHKQGSELGPFPPGGIFRTDTVD